ncbi:MAG TPA: type II secretion system protein GspM [Azospirillaceae bacterium]|nr:type II secretion system protein GspM [Azospirillaceae bacterium]
MPSLDRLPSPGSVRARLLAVGLLALVMLAITLGIVRPVAGLVAASQEEAVLLQTRLEGYRRVIARRAEIERALTEREDRQETGGDYLVGATSALAAADLQRRVAEIAARRGGRIASQLALPEREDDGFKRIATQARLSASAEALRDLLHDIEQGRPRLLVEGLSVRAAGNDGRLDVTLTIYGYQEMGR